MFVTSVCRSCDFFTAVAWNAAMLSTNSNVLAAGRTDESFTAAAGRALLVSISCCDVGSNFTEVVPDSTGSVFTFLISAAVSSAFSEPV